MKTEHYMRKYAKPTSEIVELQDDTTLLNGSPVSGSNSINDWEDGGTTEDEIDM